MFEVKAYVKQVKMEAVIDALAQLECVTGMTIGASASLRKLRIIPRVHLSGA